ncbi:hypothetical protein V6N12_012940 [Hibiscus sabdariffa]|uniref:Uncharacterized protein n=1 Tax=Hibiscus sabdariffa TaxID=183260 RepID=A0ABR2EFV5_9ROSI
MTVSMKVMGLGMMFNGSSTREWFGYDDGGSGEEPGVAGTMGAADHGVLSGRPGSGLIVGFVRVLDIVVEGLE